MAPTITVNGLTLCHKGSGGIATSTLPDVCKTPTPVGTIDINYVNVAMDSDLADGSETVTADGGNSIAIDGCKFAKSQGDEPGSSGGVQSGVNLGEATFISFSPDVTIEGKAACRLSDKMMMNKENSACMAGIVIAPVAPAQGTAAEVELGEKQVLIHLVDDANVPIPEVRIIIFDYKGNEVFAGVLDENGSILVDLPEVGVYFARYPELETDGVEDVYVHTDGRLYYPVDVKNGDTIKRLGVTKGFNSEKSHQLAEKKINFTGPKAARLNKNSFELKPSSVLYLQLRDALSSEIVTHQVFYATRAVRCVYDDPSREPLRHRYVLFWELNDDLTDFKFGPNGKLNKWKNGSAPCLWD